MDQTTQDTLQHLVTAGAELVVTGADADVVFTAPLARTWRLDPDDPDCLWLRPIAAPVAGDDETTVFSLSQCRRRALDITAVHPDGEALVIELATGQHARIQPATGTAADTLDAWDTFLGARLNADEEHALDALEEDSWTGRYA